MSLHRLIYVSERANFFDWADLKEIVAKSAENNARLGITGLLVLSDRYFLQVLEGPTSELSDLYGKILRDARHKNPRLLGYTPIHEQVFQIWSMRGVNLVNANSEFAERLSQKYGAVGRGVQVPNDPWLAFSLLYDVYCDARQFRVDLV